MAHLRFLWDNLVDKGVVDASSEDVEFPAENVQHELFLKHWRAAGIAEWLCVDLSSSGILDKAVRAWAIKYHNLDFVSGDDYRIQASAADLCGSGVPGSGELDDPFVPTEEIIVGFFASPQTYDSWKFVLDSSGSKGSGEYQRIGRLFLGDYFEPAYEVTITPEVIEADDSDLLASRQGQEYANVITQYEIVTYVWRILPASDIAKMKAIFREVGRHKSFFVCEDADQSGGAYTVTRYVKNIESWAFGPVVHGWGSVAVRVKTER
jgi:hypothetical protein